MQFKPEVQTLKDYEMELIGFPISNNPKKQIMELSDYIDNTSLSEIKEEKIYGEMYSFIGKIKSVRPTKNGSYFMVITDENDDITTFIKKDTYEKIGDKLSNNSNYFRIWGSLNKSSNPDKYADNLKLESIRYFNTSIEKEIVLRCPENLGPQNLKEVLTNIKNDAIMNSEDINYRLSVMFYDENMKLHEFKTKIDYWVNDIQSIGSIIVRYGLTVVN